ncbi:hypothetical protein AK812_SmicGene23139 [Symbiodinium microadriaticum]|uniref:Uncharacterized protein n=1 Tax=Symbiodinium microadriaticum TaxID=2951 RepID=A0A1Q9DI56_SYMMI|nr:hypothetical protein AK812_SmicGene23139 [Symbiodinium microadriaticum]
MLIIIFTIIQMFVAVIATSGTITITRMAANIIVVVVLLLIIIVIIIITIINIIVIIIIIIIITIIIIIIITITIIISIVITVTIIIIIISARSGNVGEQMIYGETYRGGLPPPDWCQWQAPLVSGGGGACDADVRYT